MSAFRVCAAALFGLCPVLAQVPTIGGCPAFPANNIWNTPVDRLPVAARTADYINSITRTGTLRWDAVIPINIVPGSQPKVPINLSYDGESDPGPYPFPPDAQFEPGDRHVIVVDKDNCVLYETYNSVLQANGSWNAESSAKWSLLSNALRPASWTSADAAGLPIAAGLVRYEEVLSGQINHAIRFTAPRTQRLYVWPARHYASLDTSALLPPMGQRFRLKAAFDVSSFPAHVQVILRAMKKYGIMLADNGLPWEMQLAADPRWDENELVALRSVAGSNLEAVDVTSLIVGADSGQAVQSTSQLAAPLPGSALPGAAATLSWPAAVGADYYWLDIGTAPDQDNVFAGQTAATSAAVNGLPCDGRTLYAQLSTHLAVGGWQPPQRSSYKAASACAAGAQMTSPAAGSVLAGTTQTFAWTPAAGADSYKLDLGSSAGAGDLASIQTAATSQTVSGLPCDGRTIYLRLSTHQPAGWQAPQQLTYVAASNCSATAAITSPPPGATLACANVTFTWSAVPGADSYWLDLGSAAGQGDISASQTPGTSRMVSSLPCDGRTVYAQLQTHLNGVWQTARRYTYVAGGAASSPAAPISPAPGSKLPGSMVTFSWTAPPGATSFWLDVGTVPGQANIFTAMVGGDLSRTVSGIPTNGAPVYVQLWSLINLKWTPARYTYTAASH